MTKNKINEAVRMSLVKFAIHALAAYRDGQRTVAGCDLNPTPNGFEVPLINIRVADVGRETVLLRGEDELEVLARRPR